MPPKKTIAEIRERLKDAVAAAKRVLATPDGRGLLEALEREYLYGTLMSDSVERTAFNLGSREVVLYLRELRDHEGNP